MFIFHYLILFEYRNVFVPIIYFIYCLNFLIRNRGNVDGPFLLLFYRCKAFGMGGLGRSSFKMWIFG